MTYKIAAVQVLDYKRIRDITIRPDVDRALLLLAGANAQGKSSVLDALEVAIGGKSAMAGDPVRHGALGAEIRVRLEGDQVLQIRRTIEPDGNSVLEVRDDLGAMKSPQAVLDKIVGARFLDPLAFLNLKSTDQRDRLLALVDRDGKIKALDTRRERVFLRRTEVSRDLKRATAQLAGMPELPAPDGVIDIAALASEERAANDVIRKFDRACKDAEHASTSTARLASEVARMEAELAELQHRVERTRMEHSDSIDDRIAKTKICEQLKPEWERATKLRLEIEPAIKRAHDHNTKAAAAAAAVSARQQQRDGVAKIEAEHAKLEDEIQRIDAEKAVALAAAALPVAGLGVTATAITFNDTPLEQASRAEQVRVALALAASANTGLRDFFIRDGAVLDDDNLAAIAEFAKTANVRVWIERVGTRDEGAIVIHDGTVVAVDAVPTTQGRLFQ